MNDQHTHDVSRRAIALIRAVHHDDSTGVAAALYGLDTAGDVAVMTARLAEQLITANLPVSVDEVCDRAEANLYGGSS